jgi:hypothetical protein
VGQVERHVEKLAITGTEGQLLIALHAEPGSPSERSLTLLAGMAGGERRRHTSNGPA